VISDDHPLLRPPLRGLAALYGCVVRARNRRYDRPGVAARARLPVVSIGNLAVGGTGKTPLVAWLARRLRDEGYRPAIVSRGYGGRAGRGPLVVSRGEGPLCDVGLCGDEPYLLACEIRGVPVVVGADRLAAANAARAVGATIVLLDDGFQHRRLARDLDVVLLDAEAPFGNGRLLPAGILREPPSGLVRADVVMLTGCRSPADELPAESAVRRVHPRGTILRSGRRRLGFHDPSGRAVPAPLRAVAFCGIAAPRRFRADVEAEGVAIVAFEARRDHHVFRRSELERLRAHAFDLDAALVTTEKDRVRLPASTAGASRPLLLTLRIEADPFEPEALVAPIRSLLGGRAA
jgi:tetraacyldisaccharide 4'-kinase